MTSRPSIHQILPSLVAGDAISNHALALRDYLQTWGFPSEIYAPHHDPCYRHIARNPHHYRGSQHNIAIYHHSIGSPLANFVLRLPDRLILNYHNITPPDLMGGHNPRFREQLMQGRAQLAAFHTAITCVADSDFNAQELASLGFEHINVVPPLIDFERLDRSVESALTRKFADGRVTLLFVGRIVPNKCQKDLISLFAYYQRLVEPHSRLLLVGSSVHAPSYQTELETHGIILGANSVELLGQVTDADLVACYRAATVYVCMSEHEGLGVPLLEAMHCRIPVLAYSATAVPYTLGTAGILFHRKRIDALAEIVDRLVNDPHLRQRIVQHQLERVAAFYPQASAPKWHSIIGRCIDIDKVR